MADWRRVTQPGEIRVIMDGSCHLSLKDRTACPGLELLIYELLANQSADAYVLVLNVQYTKHRHKQYHARKAWVKTLFIPLPSLWAVTSSFQILKHNHSPVFVVIAYT